MRLKTALVTFLSFLVILSSSALIIFLQMQAMKGLRLDTLQDRLFEENTAILGWALRNMDIERLKASDLPPSWGEIMVVEHGSLVITSSTRKEHLGTRISDIPEILDQASPVLAAIRKGSPDTVRTRDYMIALTPYGQGSTLIGFKPKSWEAGLVSAQTRQIEQGTKNSFSFLVVYLAAGFAFAVVLTVIIVLLVTRPMARVARAFEGLSLGDFTAEIPRKGEKTLDSLSDSLVRLRASLEYAMTKLGGR